jgi:hypothetical protein
MCRVVFVAGIMAVAPLTRAAAQAPPDVPVPVQAQQRDTIRQSTVAVTTGFGVSYVGFGVLGELYPLHPRFSFLVGAGGFPGGDWAPYFLGVSLGLRAYGPGRKHRLYLEATGFYYLLSSDEYTVYGPAALVGYANVASSGLAFNVAVGVGRGVDGSIAPALNIGIGQTW